MMAVRNFFTVLATLVALVSAQTFTSCDPTKKQCPDDPALGTSFNETYTLDSSFRDDYWIQEAGAVTYDEDGALFQIAQRGDAPTIKTKFYIFFGRVEVIMRAATGQGIISSIVLLSDDLDEIDWEIMGGNTTHVQSNYYGKGDVTQMNAEYFPCNGPQESYHNYTVVWTPDQLEFHLDEKLVRTLMYSDAVKGGKTIYPQTPSQVKLGNWAAGDPSSPIGTRIWAGGLTNYEEVPFDMYVKSVKIEDYTKNAVSYSYGDLSGTWQSIDIEKGESEAAKAVHAPPPLTLAQRWQNLGSTPQIAIISSVAGVAGVSFLLFIWFCIRKRRQGKRERAAEDAAFDKEQAEMLEYKRRLMQQGMARSHAHAIGIGRR